MDEASKARVVLQIGGWEDTQYILCVQVFITDIFLDGASDFRLYLYTMWTISGAGAAEGGIW